MKNVFYILCFMCLMAEISAQKVGIGTSAPQANLDVAGDARMQSMLIEPGQNGNELLKVSSSSSGMYADQNVGWAIWGGDASGWQTIIINENLTFDSIRMYFTGAQSLDTIKLFAGAWPNVTLVSALYMEDIPPGQGYHTSPAFNADLVPGTYTIWLNNIKSWSWGSGTPYPGTSSIGAGIDFKFQLYTTTTTSYLQVKGDQAAEFTLTHPGSSLKVNGKIEGNEFQLGTASTQGYVLTSNSSGVGTWAAPPSGPWTFNNGNLCYIGGNVGIDNNNPAAKLDVMGKIKTSQFQLTTGAGNGYILSSDASGNGSWVPNTVTNYWTQTGNNIYMNQTGNVGIGTSNPGYKLHVSGGGKLRIEGGMDTAPYFSFGGDGQFSIDAPNVPDGRFVVKTGGAVGVGVTNPVERLEVNGNLKFAGTGYIIQDAATQVTFQNSWSNPINIAGGAVKYVKDKQGYIHLRGLAEHPTGVNGSSVIFTLPVGFRPAFNNYINVASNINGGWCRIEIRSNGEVVSVGTGVSWVCLDNIQFRNEL